jgi:hypothetical protein
MGKTNARLPSVGERIMMWLICHVRSEHPVGLVEVGMEHEACNQGGPCVPVGVKGSQFPLDISTGHIRINIVLFKMGSEVAIERRITIKEHVGQLDLKLYAHVVLKLVKGFAHSVHALIFDEARRGHLECDDAGVATSLGRRKPAFEISHHETRMRNALGMPTGLYLARERAAIGEKKLLGTVKPRMRIVSQRGGETTGAKKQF